MLQRYIRALADPSVIVKDIPHSVSWRCCYEPNPFIVAELWNVNRHFLAALLGINPS